MIQAICAVLDYSKTRGIDKLVLICLANYCNEKRECYPSIKTLSRLSGLADSTVQIAIKRLIELGELQKVSEGGMINGKHWANTYRVRDMHPPVQQTDPVGPAELPLRGPANGEQPLISSTSYTTREGISKAKPDSEDEVIRYCLSIGLEKKHGVQMFNHWLGNGFINGGKPIKDWKAVIRSWKAAGHLNGKTEHKVGSCL